MKKLLMLPLVIFASVLSAHAQTLCSWQDIIQNSLGQGNPNATIIVLSGTTAGAEAVNTTTQPGTPLATIYADPYGATQINQTTGPLTTAAGNGWFQFWTACSSYVVIQAYGPGINGQLVYGVFVGGGSRSSISATAPIVVSPNPITGTGVISCPTCGGSAGTAFNVTSAPYNAVADASTNNATAFAAVFTASNAITSGFPTVYFPCQTGNQCQYNYAGSGVSSINPLIPTTIECDPGVTLKYTGSAHAVDVGPTGLSNAQTIKGFYRITGCRFIDSGSETEGIFVNPWISYVELDNNTFYDTPASGSSTAWAVLFSGDGNNFWMNVHDNFFTVDNGVPSNFFKTAASTNLDSQLHFNHNLAGCLATNGPPPVLCSPADAGVGVLSNAAGSEIMGNDINFMNPDIILGGLSGGTSVSHNNLEPPSTTSGTTPVIQYGLSSDSSATTIDGLQFTDNYMYDHGSSPFLAPATGFDIITGSSIKGLHFGGFSGSGPANLVVQNTTAPNAPYFPNIAQGYECPHFDEGTSAALTCPPLRTYAANLVEAPPWKILDALNFSDGFNRADGTLVAPWVSYLTLGSATITSDVLVGVGIGSGNMLGKDFGPNYREGIVFSVVPTGTDFICEHFRATNGSGFSTASLYETCYVSGTGIELFKDINNSATQLGSTYTTTTPGVGSSLEIEGINSTLNVYLNGLLIISAVDATLSTGYAAIVFGGTSGAVASFTVRGLP